MENNFRLLKPDNELWMKFLSSVNYDFYHTPDYLILEANKINGKPAAIYIQNNENTLFIPLIIRKIPYSDHLDAISPYGYPCPLFLKNELNTIIPLIKILPGALKSFNIISAFIRLHPILSDYNFNPFIVGKLVNHGRTVYIDLHKSNAEIWRQTRSTTKNLINQLKREGFQASLDVEFEFYEEFIEIYYETMNSLNASNNYFFPKKYFYKLKNNLKEKLFLCLVKDKNNKIAAGGLFTSNDGIVQYHLSGSREAYKKNSPIRLMIDFIRIYFKNKGAKVMHLGGGVGCNEDNLFNFKKGFSKEFSEFHSWRLICDETIYDFLCKDFLKNQDPLKEESQFFFPLYRS